MDLPPTSSDTNPGSANVNADAGASSQPTPKPEAPRSSGNSVRDDVAAAFKEIEARPDPKAPKADKPIDGDIKPDAPKTDAKSGEPQRGPDGKFVKADDQAQQPAPVDPKAAQQPQPLSAPAAWNGAGKVDWQKLPRSVQEQIVADYKFRAELEAKYTPLAPILSQREAALVAQYGGVPQALNQLFALSDFASQNPAGFLNWFAAQRGINLQQLVQPSANPGQQHGGQPEQAFAGIDPALKPLVDELNGIKRFLSQQQQAGQQLQQVEAQQVHQQANAEVQAFIANSAEFPYANDLRNEMAAIFASGGAKTLKDAYEAAAWRVPHVRDRMIADRTKAELEKQAAAAAEKKNAGVSVSGSPGGQPIAGNGNRKATVRDDVRAAAAEIGFMGISRL